MNEHRRSSRSSPFTADECRAWRRRLTEERARLLADRQLLTAESAGDPSTRRDGDLLSGEVAIGEQEDLSRTMQQIDAALAKLDGRGAVPYGICEATGGRIERERLELMPWTPLSSRGAALSGG